MDTGAAPIDDPAELARVRRQARKVWAYALATAGGLTALLAALP